MRRIMFPMISITILMMFSCASGLEEIVAETYADGTPKVVKFYDGEGGGKTMVKEATYYPSGQVRMEGEYKNGVKHGYWISYYQNGNKWSEGWYVESINHGQTTTWHENGQVYYKGQFNQGNRSGTWKFWDENGDFIKKINYDVLNALK